MSDEIGLFEALYTQRAIRHLRPDPVPQELVHRVLEAATKAPSAENRQPWRFVVIQDAGLKEVLAVYYGEAWEQQYGPPGSRPSPSRIEVSATHLAHHLAEVPVLILACLETRESPSSAVAAGRPMAPRYASIYPAVQNLLLAARGLGLGAVLTTVALGYEQEIRAILDIPDNMELCALIPLGWPTGEEPYGPTTRRSVEELTHYDRWGNQQP